MFLDKNFIGQKFKQYRKTAKLSQEETAEKAEIAEKHYGRLERGLCVPTLETFFKLINILNIPLSEFGYDYKKTENKTTNEIIKEIYLSEQEENQAYLEIIKSIKKLRGR